MADLPPQSLAEALAKLQQHLPRIGKDSEAVMPGKNGGRPWGYKYADLATISAVLLPELGKHGLSFTACPTMTVDEPARFVLEYQLRCALPGGEVQQLSGCYPLPISGTPQQIGSAITYARRYCLLAVTGAAPDEDDDDAQAAEQAARAQRNTPPETRADGSATEAELTRMSRGHEPGVERLGTTPVDDGWYDEPGQPLNPPSEEAWGSIGPQQKTRMFAMFTGLGMREKEKQLAFIEEVAGVRVHSRNDLSYVQAGAVLEALELRSGAHG